MESEAGESRDIKAARQEIATSEAQAVDIRDESDWSEGHVPGAIHLPASKLEVAGEVFEAGQRLVVIADDDDSGAEAVAALRESGFEAVVAEGGMDAWRSEGFTLQPTDDPDADTEIGRG